MIRRERSVLARFLASSASGGIVLIMAALLAMILANSAAAPAYDAVLHQKLGPLSIHHWINDGLMALFFFVVGLEVKREALDGHLVYWSDRILPGIAAIAGMVVPAIVFLWIVGGEGPLIRGWAIPAATDIAFALGILALAGKSAPPSLKLFLTSVAIIDDIGAIIIIALFYSDTLAAVPLLAAAIITGALVLMNRSGERRAWPYMLGFACLWLAVLASGIHATLAGVVAALTVPLSRDDKRSTLHRLEGQLHPWVAFAIVPIFGLANAGVSLTGIGREALFAPLTMGIAAGLFVGKQVGVFAAVRAAVALGLAKRPAFANWWHVHAVATLCGVGFTMSLFIGDLAFDDPLLSTEVKMGVLLGSALSGVTGWLLLKLAGAPLALARKGAAA